MDSTSVDLVANAIGVPINHIKRFDTTRFVLTLSYGGQCFAGVYVNTHSCMTKTVFHAIEQSLTLHDSFFITSVVPSPSEDGWVGDIYVWDKEAETEKALEYAIIPIY